MCCQTGFELMKKNTVAAVAAKGENAEKEMETNLEFGNAIDFSKMYR